MSKLTAAEKLEWIQEILADPFKGMNGKLDPIERKAGRLASRGATYDEIGAELGVPVNTAGSIVKRLSAKTGLAKKEMPGFVFKQIDQVLDE